METARTATIPVPTVPAGPGRLVAIERYFALGIDIERRTTILAAADYTEVGCEQLTIERQENEKMPYKTFKVFVWGEHAEQQVRDWLKTWGWSGQQARNVWRDTHANMMGLIKDQVKQHQIAVAERQPEQKHFTRKAMRNALARKKSRSR